MLAVRSTWAAPSLFAEVEADEEFAGEGKQHPSNTASSLAGQKYFPDCHDHILVLIPPEMWAEEVSVQ